MRMFSVQPNHPFMSSHAAWWEERMQINFLNYVPCRCNASTLNIHASTDLSL
jgi:hypothetical protein